MAIVIDCDLLDHKSQGLPFCILNLLEVRDGTSLTSNKSDGQRSVGDGGGGRECERAREGGSGKRNVEGPRPRRLQHTEPAGTAPQLTPGPAHGTVTPPSAIGWAYACNSEWRQVVATASVHTSALTQQAGDQVPPRHPQCPSPLEAPPADEMQSSSSLSPPSSSSSHSSSSNGSP